MWLFSWAAAIVLVVSFVALSVLWTRPQLQSEQPRAAVSDLAPVVDGSSSLLGVAVFALVALQRLRRHAKCRSANFSVTFIYVIFWVGMPIASVLLGDVFAVLSPWRSCARAIRWAGAPAGAAGLRDGRRCATRERLGQWPAVAAG